MLLVRELNFGGCERDLSRIARGLDRTVFTPHVGCFVPDGMRAKEISQAGVPILQLPVKSFKDSSWLKGIFELRRYCRQHGIRLIHAFDTPTDSFLLPTVLWPGKPKLLLSHFWYRSMWDPLYQRLLRYSDHVADRLIVNSDAVRRELIDVEKRDERNIWLCYNGVDSNEFHARDRKRMAPLDENGGPVIGSLCVLREEKKLEWLIEAAARLQQRGEQFQLLLVGSGPHEASLHKEAAAKLKPGSFHFVPQQSSVGPWLRAMDIYVSTSRIESFPNGVLEALTCGCSVVATRVGGVPEMVSDGENGLLFEPGDIDTLTTKLSSLLTNDDYRRRLQTRAAQEAPERFSMEYNVQRTSDIYLSMLEGSTTPRLPVNYRPTALS
jgi:L-malate glycosyltransferase